MTERQLFRRGHKAPYKTQTVRVPLALIPLVESMKAKYVDYATQPGADPQDSETFIQEVVLKVLDDEVVTRKKKIRVL